MHLAPLLVRANATQQMRELRKEIQTLEAVKQPDYFQQLAKQRRIKKLKELKTQFIFKIYDADDPGH